MWSTDLRIGTVLHCAGDYAVGTPEPDDGAAYDIEYILDEVRTRAQYKTQKYVEHVRCQVQARCCTLPLSVLRRHRTALHCTVPMFLCGTAYAVPLHVFVLQYTDKTGKLWVLVKWKEWACDIGKGSKYVDMNHVLKGHW